MLQNRMCIPRPDQVPSNPTGICCRIARQLPQLGSSRERDFGHQFSRLNPQGSRERLDRLQADRSLPPFDQADVGPMKPSGVRQSFLAQF